MSDRHDNGVSATNISHSTDATFEADVLNSELPVLVDFWAEWCGPCKMIAPVLEELANEFEGRIKIVKHDVQNNPASAQKYAVRNIPALMIFKNGQIESQHVGVASKTQLAGFMEAAL